MRNTCFFFAFKFFIYKIIKKNITMEELCIELGVKNKQSQKTLKKFLLKKYFLKFQGFPCFRFFYSCKKFSCLNEPLNIGTKCTKHQALRNWIELEYRKFRVEKLQLIKASKILEHTMVYWSISTLWIVCNFSILFWMNKF